MIVNEAAAALESFKEAFRGGVCGPRRTCECGVTYWDTYNVGYSWDVGELEKLENDPQARGVGHAIGTIEFEGGDYVDACECWKARAKHIVYWLRSHDTQIAEFLNLEKKRKAAEADRAPTVSA